MPKKGKPKRPQKRAVNKKPAFLAAFVACASLTEAAAAVGIDRGQHYDWLKSDPKYAEAFAEARTQAGQTLEDDAVEWARKGVYEPIVYQGQFQFAQRERVKVLLLDGREIFEEELPENYNVDFVVSRRTIVESYGPPLGVHRRSEGLMGRLLKAFLPSRYADRTEISGANGGAIELSLADVIRDRRAKREAEETKKTAEPKKT